MGFFFSLGLQKKRKKNLTSGFGFEVFFFLKEQKIETFPQKHKHHDSTRNQTGRRGDDAGDPHTDNVDVTEEKVC